jgi:hypothetical protein
MTSADPVETFLDALLAMDRVAAKRALGGPARAMAGSMSSSAWSCRPSSASGILWERGEVSLSQVYMSGRMCEEMVDAILPSSDPHRVDQPPMAIAVLDDYHLLGKRMVYSVLRASGYELKDYGTVDGDALVSRVVRDGIVVLLISVLDAPLRAAYQKGSRCAGSGRLSSVHPGGRCALSFRHRAVAGGRRRRHGRVPRPRASPWCASSSRICRRSIAHEHSTHDLARTRADTLDHREPDRVPMFLLLTMHGAQELGLPIETYFSRPEYVIEGQLRLRRKYRNDCFYTFFYASVETEAWGGDVLYADDGPPNAGQPVIRRPEQIRTLEPRGSRIVLV